MVNYMAFSKGKRIEDETSIRIVDLAVNIGCKEGYDALTVTRLCKELNCDRRVVYNRFRDVDEINLIVAERCNQELIAGAKASILDSFPFSEKYQAFIKNIFAYIYERNANFQYYTSLYQIEDGKIDNGVLRELIEFLEQGKNLGEIKSEVNCSLVAQNIWVMIVGFSSMLSKHVSYPYQDALNSLLVGVTAIYHEIEK